MTADVDGADLTADVPEPRPGLGTRLWRAVRWLPFLGVSSLTRRIVLLNIAGLVALLSGILYLNQFRAGLIDARVQSLLTQGEIIAGAVAASATIDTNALWIDPNKLLELQAGESLQPYEDGISALEFPINPERVAPVLRRLVTPTRTRARIYDREGQILLDSRSLYARGDILRFDLPPPYEQEPPLPTRIWNGIQSWFASSDLPTYEELGTANGRGYPEVARALAGSPASIVRQNERGAIIVSVAVPIQRFRAVTGVLLLSTQGGDIDAIVQAERIAIVRVFLVAAAVMVVLSVLLAGTIAGPVRRLADAADHVRRRVKQRTEIPDFTERSDEIGHLSRALRDMTHTLYNRIEAIESFAADVSHELKNPLTSLRSAVETLPLAKTDDAKGRLLNIIQHDVRRLDRLITDISDASRLDAELQRQDAEPVDVITLLAAVTTLQNEIDREDGVKITLKRANTSSNRDAYYVLGHDSRLGQVVTNLVENARSFSPRGGEVRVICRRVRNEVEIAVEDDGPGIRPDALDRIFERFYTDRPGEGFGQNSGLGLSISKQIVEAHGGRIWAENRLGGHDAEGIPTIIGARFHVRLPAAGT
jgi:two-component system sensor histidine kinase ChvG